MRRKRNYWWLVGALLLPILMIGCQEEAPEGVVSSEQLLAAAAEVGSVTAEGQIVPIRHLQLSFEVGGEVVELLVEEGDVVAVGTPLIRLKDTDVALQVAQAAAGVALAEANLEAATATLEAAAAQVAQAESGVTVARAQLALVQAEPREEESLVAEGNVTAAEAGVLQALAGQQVVNEISTAQVTGAQAQVAAAQQEVKVLQDQYDELLRLEILGTPEEQARLALAAAKARLTAAEAALAEARRGATAGQRQSASAGIRLAEAQQTVAEANLALLLADPRREQVVVYEAGVSQAEAALAQAQVGVLQAETGVSQAEAALVQAETGLATAEAALAKLTLVAPFEGTVAALPVEIGAVVLPGTPILTLADFRQWQVETVDLTELDVVDLAVGDTVDISFDAIDDELTAVISAIGTVPQLVRGDVTYVVTLDLPADLDLPLRWGMTVFVARDA